MDYTPDFLLNKLSVGRWVQIIVEFMTDYFETQFCYFSDALEWMIPGLITGLGLIPPLGKIWISLYHSLYFYYG